MSLSIWFTDRIACKVHRSAQYIIMYKYVAHNYVNTSRAQHENVITLRTSHIETKAIVASIDITWLVRDPPHEASYRKCIVSHAIVLVPLI